MRIDIKEVARLCSKPVAPIIVPLMKTYVRHFPLATGKRFCMRSIRFFRVSYIIQTIFGSIVKDQTTDMIQRFIFCFGVWEPNLTHFIENRLKGLSDRTFIDVGANIGYFSLLAAELMPHGRVISVEALPSIYANLKENININKYTNITAINCAVTDTTHRVSMYPADIGNQGATTSIQGIINSAPINVDGRPLSDILSESQVRSTRLIKIDTEGGEYAVFKGLLPILQQFPEDVELVIEITPQYLDKRKILDIFESLKKEGFSAYEVSNIYNVHSYRSSRKVSKPKRIETLPEMQSDIIFSRIDRDYLL